MLTLTGTKAYRNGMAAYSIRNDEAELLALTQRAEAGEEVVLARDGKPVAKLIQFPASAEENPPRRPWGLNLSGTGEVEPEFDEPMSDHELRKWGLL